ncbi:543019a3-1f7a-4d55-a45c-5c344293fc93 [Sclerotinia trifoliorum]|uniref:543019a3-1f7a-4d55-a45c-5c344293fc93 n=1 Tax=Sclerotinia trifoliorum TaxID=28548 RepID=A0A8H2VUB1_9HELO|nr:543019a3-1f7a-4d55-a45c-5c344293fc93 [Sclerotinia trifoliorum]
MTEATNTKMMDTDRGGENTPYESQNIFTQSHAKDQGTFGDATGPTEAELQKKAEHNARGERTAENIRFGEAVSEHGFGGETVGNSRGVGGAEKKEEETDDMRRKMGYGEGSGIGA